MTRHYELTDPQFALIRDLLPAPGRPGGQWNDHRTTLDGILWILHTGAQWRELPDRYGRWKSVYDRFRRWRQDGTTDRILERLRLDERGRIDHDPWCVDATSIRASRSAAGALREKKVSGEPADHALGRSRGGFGTKLHLIVDGDGLPLAATLSAGQAHESRHLEPVLDAVRPARPRRGRRRRRRPKRLAGDKGYSYPRIRRYLRRRGIKAVIPTRKDRRRNPRFDKETYRRRNVVERCMSWLKENRRIGSRHEKLAVNFLAMTKLAMIRRCFRILESPDTA